MQCRLVNNHKYLLADMAAALNQQGLCENFISRGVCGSGEDFSQIYCVKACFLTLSIK